MSKEAEKGPIEKVNGFSIWEFLIKGLLFILCPGAYGAAGAYEYAEQKQAENNELLLIQLRAHQAEKQRIIDAHVKRQKERYGDDFPTLKY